MALKKIKLGDLIEQVLEVNNDLKFGINDVMGMTLTKEIIPTKADINNKELPKFIIVSPKDFVFNPRTHGKKIGFGYNNENKKFLISWNNIAFRVKQSKLYLLLPDYLWIWLRRDEWDRFAAFNSWGSSTEVFSWSALCDMEIDLPSIEIQRKYVEIYKGMVDNQIAYETGLEDLKLVCDGFVENLKKTVSTKPIGQFIVELSEKNDGSITLAQGVDVNLQFIPAKREAEDKESGKIVHNGEFAFNKVVKCNGTKLPIALRKGPTCFISGSYTVFKVIDETKLIPEYLMLWMSREETQRKCGFNAWGSTRDVLPFEELCQLEIPYPNIKVQQAIVDIYNSYIERKQINEQLKQQIKNICPILIKGAVEEELKHVKE